MRDISGFLIAKKHIRSLDLFFLENTRSRWMYSLNLLLAGETVQKYSNFKAILFRIPVAKIFIQLFKS